MAWLLDVSLKVSVLMLAAGVTLALMRRTSAASRHVAVMAALGAALLLPAAKVQLPALPLSVLAPAPAPAVVPPAVTMPVTAPVVAMPELPSISFPAADRLPIETPFASVVPAPAPAWPLSRVFVWLWIAGTAGVLMNLGVAISRIRAVARAARPVTDHRMMERLAAAKRHFGVRRPVALLVSPREWMPITWGVIRPRILLPASAASWPKTRIDAVLLHEMAHIARGDIVAQRLARAAVALFWFNPLVWLAARRARVERERACDDAVLARGMRATDYASDLIELAQTLAVPSRTAASALAVARRSQLEARISALLDGRVSRQGTSTLGRACACGLVVLMLPIAAAQLAARSFSAPQPLGTREIVSPPAQTAVADSALPQMSVRAPRAAVGSPPADNTSSSLDQTPAQNPTAQQPRANWRLEREAMLKQLAERARAFVRDAKAMVAVGSAPQIAVNSLEDALAAIERAMPAPNTCSTPDPYVNLGGGDCVNGGWLPPGSNGPNPTNEEIAAAKAEFSSAMRNLDTTTRRWNSGLSTTGEIEAALRAALNILTGDIKGPDSTPFVRANFPGATDAELTNAQRLYELLTGRVSSIGPPTASRWFSGQGVSGFIPPPAGYVIGVNDVLVIAVSRENGVSETGASGVVTVRPDGKITPPKGNPILAAGLTPEELKLKVTEEMKKFYKEPAVTVQVKEIHSRSVFVTNPDNIPIRFVTRSGTNTLSDAELTDVLKGLPSIMNDTQRANLLLALADNYAFTPEMVTLYVAAAKGITSPAEQARVFAKAIRIK